VVVIKFKVVMTYTFIARDISLVSYKHYTSLKLYSTGANVIKLFSRNLRIFVIS
jgi:hypothetical protein